MWTIAAITAAMVITPPPTKVGKLKRQASREQWRLVDLRYDRFCIEAPDQDPQSKMRKRLVRRYRSEIEDRANCDVARFPKGRGYAVLVLPQADKDTLQTTREQLDIGLWTVIQDVINPQTSTLVCISKWELEPSLLSQELLAQGQRTESIWEVGSCHPQ